MQLTVHYDGSAFHGWQYQPDQRTVQGDLQAALAQLADSPRTVLGAGRTDTGVHATGQVASVDMPERWTSAELLKALNATLPREIWVESVRRAAPDFHPRYDAIARTYTYRVGVGWDFLRGDNYAIGVSGGLHATNFVIQLEGEASFAGATTEFVTRKRNALAPLPTLGVHGEVEVIPRLTLRGKLDYLDLTLNNASGRIFNGEAMLLYNINDNIALGAGYRHVDMRLELAKQDWTGSIDYQFDGPKLTLKVGLR